MEGALTFSSVRFQVWRPISACEYQFQGQQRVENYNVGRDYLLDTSTVPTPPDPIPVQPGDIVGIYVEHRRFAGFGVQQYSEDSSTVYVNADISPQLDFCEGGVSTVRGAPIVNAVVSIAGELVLLLVAEVKHSLGLCLLQFLPPPFQLCCPQTSLHLFQLLSL